MQLCVCFNKLRDTSGIGSQLGLKKNSSSEHMKRCILFSNLASMHV
jgi:hypothetical protein